MTELIVSQIVNGLVLGFLYVLIAIGLSIIFGMLGVVNFAHGVFFALGAYFALSLRDTIGPWAIVLAPIFVGAAGMLIESSLLRPLYGKEPLLGLFMTFGIGYWMVSADMYGNRNIVILGMIGKLAFSVVFVANIVLFRGQVPLLFLIPVTGDLVFVVLFWMFLRFAASRSR